MMVLIIGITLRLIFQSSVYLYVYKQLGTLVRTLIHLAASRQFAEQGWQLRPVLNSGSLLLLTLRTK